VPADLVAIVGKREEKVSLRTRDSAEATAAYHKVAADIDRRWASLRQGTRRISHREAEVIAGEFYRKLIAEHEADPGDPAIIVARLLSDKLAAGDPAVKISVAGNPLLVNNLMAAVKNQNRPDVAANLRDRGEIVDDDSLDRVVVAVNAAILQGRKQLLRYARGDYRPDPDADRFPEREAPTASANPSERPADFYDLKTIYEKLAGEAKHSASTRKKWRAVIAQVAAEVPDIRELTDLWCVGWKDRLLARGLSARSVQFGGIDKKRKCLGGFGMGGSKPRERA
jgi:hypothetical protein